MAQWQITHKATIVKVLAQWNLFFFMSQFLCAILYSISFLLSFMVLGFKYSYLILKIFKEVYLTHRLTCTPNLNQSECRSNDNAEIAPHSSDIRNYILCPYRAVVDMSKLVIQYMHIRVKESIGESRLWVRPYFSNSIRHILFVSFGWF